ncbi:MAG: PHP domain-containing protein [Ruminococcaceae bacterium]|nr:PHP domain-containing protein [Oscillospiraceae bacterium]
MKKYFYDLHIHSCLSPCGDDDMTPNNIVNMAKIKELDIIALSDHNSVRNCRAAIKVGQEVGITVLPAMELTSSEDIHILCLFADIEKAEAFEDYVYDGMLKIKNDEELYGQQLIMNENDEVTGSRENLLIVASGIDTYSVCQTVESYGGVAIAAHIDKDSNSLVATMGALEKDMGFCAFELSKSCNQSLFFEKYPSYKNDYVYISNSDAHYLWDINENINFMELEAPDAQNVIAYIKSKA